MTHTPPPNPYGPYYETPAPKPRTDRRTLIAIGVIVVLLIVLGLTSLGGDGDDQAADPAPAAPSTAASTPTPSAEQPEGITDGTWAVGEDIEPGRYRTSGPTGGYDDCRWDITTDANGTDSIAYDLFVQGQAYVELEDGQYFETRRCERWQPA